MSDNSLLNKQIGKRIREARLQKKMSQADLAEGAHIHLSHVSDIELGKRKCDFQPLSASRRRCKFRPIS